MLKQQIKRYFSTLAYFYRYLRYRVFIVVGLSIFIGLLDGIGLAMFLPMLQLADGSSSASSENMGNMQFILTGVQKLGFELSLPFIVSLLLFFFLAKGVVVYIASLAKVNINQFFISSLRIRLTGLLSRFSYKSFVQSDVGRIQNSMTGEIGMVTNAYKFYTDCMQQIVMVLVYAVLVFLVDWKFALLVVTGGVITNSLYGRIYKKTKAQSKALTENNSSYQGLIIQYVANFKYLKATGYLSRFGEKLKAMILNIEANNKKIGYLSSFVTASREPMLIAVVCAVILVQVFVLEGALAPILVSLLFFYRALTALLAFQASYNNFLGVSGSLDNIWSFEQLLRGGKEQPGKLPISGFHRSIELKELDFSYQKNIPILKGVSLEIKKNQTIAFVGESGSGKTTLINLISGLIPPTRGDIFIDGQHLQEINKESYQRRIGYIAQEPVIFNDTIFNNISFWDTPNAANLERFNKAVQQAAIAEFIMELPGQEATLLGNNGINLSGGQKQRISIARELYKDVDILLLDEATSALDSETEKDIQSNLDRLKGQYTLLIIAHRLSTIKNADLIYLLAKGKIVGSGSFGEMTQSSKQFKRMVDLQEV